MCDQMPGDSLSPLSKHRSETGLGDRSQTEATECWALGMSGVWRREALAGAE